MYARKFHQCKCSLYDRTLIYPKKQLMLIFDSYICRPVCYFNPATAFQSFLLLCVAISGFTFWCLWQIFVLPKIPPPPISLLEQKQPGLLIPFISWKKNQNGASPSELCATTVIFQMIIHLLSIIYHQDSNAISSAT